MKKNKKETKDNVFCVDSKCFCDMKQKLAEVFPYHQPNCLTEADYELLCSDSKPEDLLGEMYGRIFNADSSYSEKRYEQLQRIAQEYK